MLILNKTKKIKAKKMTINDDAVWIENEQKILERERCEKKKKNRDNEIMRHFLIMLAITFISFHSMLKADLNFKCSGCQHNTVYHGIWGDTWICPNTNCGYENYEAMRYCGICGTDRYSD